MAREATTSPDQLDGVLLVDKPPGPTSHDAVMVARRALATRRIGHTGTLDPFASGLLLLCIGRATRLAQYLSHLPKTYQAVLRFGEQTDTHDHTGAVTARAERWRTLTRADLERALARRVGRQMQTPPEYSAKKVAGERLYARARRGETVTPVPVEVEIMTLSLTAWDPPDASVETTCSSGTYVRAIARDIGLDLESFAHLAALRRTAVGPHLVRDAVPLGTLQEGGWNGQLMSGLEALAHLPRLDLDDAAAAAIRHGRTVPAPTVLTAAAVLLAWRGRLLAIGEADGGRVQPRQVLDDE